MVFFKGGGIERYRRRDDGEGGIEVKVYGAARRD